MTNGERAKLIDAVAELAAAIGVLVKAKDQSSLAMGTFATLTGMTTASGGSAAPAESIYSESVSSLPR